MAAQIQRKAADLTGAVIRPCCRVSVPNTTDGRFHQADRVGKHVLERSSWRCRPLCRDYLVRSRPVLKTRRRQLLDPIAMSHLTRERQRERVDTYVMHKGLYLLDLSRLTKQRQMISPDLRSGSILCYVQNKVSSQRNPAMRFLMGQLGCCCCAHRPQALWSLALPC